MSSTSMGSFLLWVWEKWRWCEGVLLEEKNLLHGVVEAVREKEKGEEGVERKGEG